MYDRISIYINLLWPPPAAASKDTALRILDLLLSKAIPDPFPMGLASRDLMLVLLKIPILNKILYNNVLKKVNI